MRLPIGTRIFLTLTAISLVILTLNALITRWTFERGFIDYVAEQELATINDTASSLVSLYRDDGGWEAIRDDPRQWNEILRRNSPRPPEHGPPPRGGPRDGRPGRPPPRDPLELGRRVSLLDADGAIVVGPRPATGEDERVPVVADGKVVGYVSISRRRQLTDRLDQDFLRQQERSIYIVAIVALLVAALISALMARHLTRPIRALAEGARGISGGDYGTRMATNRNDELGDLAHEFNRLAETLESNRLSRQRWVADIAHELRTPLSVLRGELDAVEDGVRAFNEGTRKSLQAETARLSRLVDELHELSMYDEGGQSFDFEVVDVVALLRKVVAGSEQRLVSRGIEVALRIPDTRIVVSADATKLERVFLNLIENSLRYTDAPGRLVVSAAERPGHAIIEFADSAPGVPVAARERLFDRLYRVDESRSRETGGSGLGLAICRSIVEGHGGGIEAAASDLGGVSMRISLPVAGRGDDTDG